MDNTITMRPLKDVLNLACAELLAPYKSTHLGAWENFDRAIGGLRAREFSILCGSTGTGKTTLLANISMQLLLQRVKHYVASVETGDTDFCKRVLSALVNEDLNTGEKIELDRVRAFRKQYEAILENNEDLYLSIFDNRVSLELLLQDLERAHREHGCKIAMLDNLNFFMEVTAAQNQLIEMDRTIHELIMFCKRVDMHVIMVMHPKKTLNGRVESEFDIKGSSTAVQEAHNVFLFNRPSEEDQCRFSHEVFRELKIAKLRRRGGFVGKRIMFKNLGSAYVEETML
jgi:twinkle protein